MTQSKPRILFVDDEELILEAIRRMFLRHRRNEWDMVFTTDPHDALEKQNEAPFDVVVTDLRMPDLNGIELAKEIHDKDKSTQIIMLSGTADIDAAMEVINSTTIFRFYTKPCEPESLEEGIEECLLRIENKKNIKTGMGVKVLDKLPIGVIVCETNGHVLHMNQFGTQICNDHDGLSVDIQGVLRTTQPAMRMALMEALIGTEDKEPVALALERIEEERPLSLIISHFEEGQSEKRLLLVSAPEKHSAPTPEVLQSIYEMPLSEAKLLHLIVSGFQLKPAAEKLNITEGSARTYLKRIFMRTNTNSQPELVRAILMTPSLHFIK